MSVSAHLRGLLGSALLIGAVPMAFAQETSSSVELTSATGSLPPLSAYLSQTTVSLTSVAKKSATTSQTKSASSTLMAVETGRKTLKGSKARRPSTIPGIGDSSSGDGRLSLDSVVRLAGRNYPKLAGLDAERRQAAFRSLAAAGAFDLTVRGGRLFDQYNKDGKITDFTSDFFSVELPLRQGPTLFATGTLNDGTVKSPASTTGDDGLYGVGIRMPLLRGLGTNPREAAERQALLGEGRADAEYAADRQMVLMSAAAQWWNWVGAGMRVNIARDLLSVAEMRSDQIAAEVMGGARQEMDIFEADAEVARREEALAKATRDLEKEAIKLGLYMWQDDPRDNGYPSMKQLPPAMPMPPGISVKQLNEDRKVAHLRRPEVAALKAALHQAQIDTDVARNDMLPNLDVSVAPGRDFGDNAVGEQWKYGVSFAMPIQQRAARGKLGEARLKVIKIQQEIRLLTRQVEADVDDAASAVRRAGERYTAAVREAEAAEQLLRGEEQRLLLGEGTLFLVNQRERAAAEAQVKVINARADQGIAVAAYKAATAAY